MKTTPLTLLFSVFLFVGSLMAQNSNLIFFSEAGDKFTLTLNGVSQNDAPKSNVKVTGLNQPGYNVQITFEDPSIASLNRNMYVTPGTESVIKIILKANGKYAMRPQSQTPISESTPQAPTKPPVAQYTDPTPDAAHTDGSNTTVSTTTTTTRTGVPDNDINVNVNVNGLGVDMKVDADDYTGTSTTYATTTTTTTSSRTSQSNPYEYPEEERTETQSESTNGCADAMSPSDFSDAKNSIENQSFSDGKLTVAKQILNSNCVNSSQVKEMMSLFSYESSKLDIAMYAYDHTTDPQNYYKINDGFTYSSSVDELNKFIQSK